MIPEKVNREGNDGDTVIWIGVPDGFRIAATPENSDIRISDFDSKDKSPGGIDALVYGAIA